MFFWTKPGGSVKAKVIQFDPATGKWKVPPGFVQKNIGYVTNGVLDPDLDQIVQIVDGTAWHLSLTTGQWTPYPLPGDVMRFNVISARLGRDVWWMNRKEVLEAYNLDTHKLTSHGPWPYPVQDGWTTVRTFAYGDKILVVWPTSLSGQQEYAALYDPATKTWTKLDQGEARGNAAMLHSTGKLIRMGGMAPPEDQNKFVWIGTLQ